MAEGRYMTYVIAVGHALSKPEDKPRVFGPYDRTSQARRVLRAKKFKPTKDDDLWRGKLRFSKKALDFHARIIEKKELRAGIELQPTRKMPKMDP